MYMSRCKGGRSGGARIAPGLLDPDHYPHGAGGRVEAAGHAYYPAFPSDAGGADQLQLGFDRVKVDALAQIQRSGGKLGRRYTTQQASHHAEGKACLHLGSRQAVGLE